MLDGRGERKQPTGRWVLRRDRNASLVAIERITGTAEAGEESSHTDTTPQSSHRSLISRCVRVVFQRLLSLLIRCHQLLAVLRDPVVC